MLTCTRTNKDCEESWNTQPYQKTIHPVLLPQSSALTKLIVLARHKESGYNGMSQTLASYWIPQVRATVKRIPRRQCMACRRWNAQPFKLPPIAPLPEERTRATRVFWNFQLVKQVTQNTLVAPITWRLITPFASWQGRVYDRLVGLTKTVIRKAVGRRLLNEEEFKTLIAECEAVAIIAAQEPSPQNDKRPPNTVDSRGELLELWKATITSLDHFWKIWTHDYLMSVREQHRTEHQQPYRVTDRAPLENEVVIVAEDGLLRTEWKLGRICEQYNRIP
uniref:DUF5641 domain-containing protein n=1 Tax=Ascaris lumbricoides TaxID=6252 RepID=A0A0M3I608_ASCLU